MIATVPLRLIDLESCSFICSKPPLAVRSFLPALDARHAPVRPLRPACFLLSALSFPQTHRRPYPFPRPADAHQKIPATAGGARRIRPRAFQADDPAPLSGCVT